MTTFATPPLDSGPASGTATGTTGDIQNGNQVASIGGMRIFTSATVPSNTVGNWHTGDLCSYTGTSPGAIYQYQPSAWAVVGEQTGVVKMYGASAAPSGYLLCDGTAVSRTTFSALFAVLSTNYGAGNGSTTFNVPDYRGRVIVGLDAGSVHVTNAGTLGTTAGEQNHALSQAELAAHTHGIGSYADSGHTHSNTFNDASHSHTAQGVQNWSGAGSTLRFATIAIVQDTSPSTDASTTGASITNASATAALGGSSGSIGSGTAHNTMQPFGVAVAIIKT